jgi:hypothetical protein
VRPQIQKAVKKNTKKGRKKAINDSDSSGEDNTIKKRRRATSEYDPRYDDFDLGISENEDNDNTDFITFDDVTI